MIVMVCIDNNNGMLFNHRRQSQDRILREDMLKMVGTGKLWMNSYSKKQFSNIASVEVLVDEEYLEKAGTGDFCFAEDKDICAYKDRIEKVILYKWNRIYPADTFFSLDLQGWELESLEEFAGSSHEKITKETYKK